ncbi:hypothetical protein LL13C17_30820 [Escherichia coli]
MLPSETMIWQPEFTDKTLSRKPGAVHYRNLYQAMVQARRFDTGSCSESCEIWGDQLELEFEEVGV